MCVGESGKEVAASGEKWTGNSGKEFRRRSSQSKVELWRGGGSVWPEMWRLSGAFEGRCQAVRG